MVANAILPQPIQAQSIGVGNREQAGQHRLEETSPSCRGITVVAPGGANRYRRVGAPSRVLAGPSASVGIAFVSVTTGTRCSGQSHLFVEVSEVSAIGAKPAYAMTPRNYRFGSNLPVRRPVQRRPLLRTPDDWS